MNKIQTAKWIFVAKAIQILREMLTQESKIFKQDFSMPELQLANR
jgi:hypothetical protein